MRARTMLFRRAHSVRLIPAERNVLQRDAKVANCFLRRIRLLRSDVAKEESRQLGLRRENLLAASSAACNEMMVTALSPMENRRRTDWRGCCAQRTPQRVPSRQ
jgi:hypothetical protein